VVLDASALEPLPPPSSLRSGGAQIRVISVAASLAEFFYDGYCMTLAIFSCQSKVRCSLKTGCRPICSMAGRGGHSGPSPAPCALNPRNDFFKAQCRAAAPLPSSVLCIPAFQDAQGLPGRRRQRLAASSGTFTSMRHLSQAVFHLCQCSSGSAAAEPAASKAARFLERRFRSAGRMSDVGSLFHRRRIPRSHSQSPTGSPRPGNTNFPASR
jgi:hypothetical protein